MTRRLLLLVFFIFLVLVGYNYLLAQEQLKKVSPTRLSVELAAFPAETTVRTPTNISWSVEGPDNFFAEKTTLFWSYDSSPSALVRTDSPEAVRYTNFLPDYAEGLFRLPDNFAADLSFPKAGTVYLRAYAKVGDNHLWTPEAKIMVK